MIYGHARLSTDGQSEGRERANARGVKNVHHATISRLAA
jgi:hypothetical protein